ncbi:LOW QUALITY PROTEIN: uncharacterized protein LOC127858921 [Dreissena polymorpha]|uniref:LOW QUALITY PROTEIN: uncharacterized protein LOC127858921 n=1 Tax=Dreissena polymorpha TaxID=45954 RepID=UPI002264A07A|nr:LOW QUALITY PROTEIN: uncharacterized protein LOC127858921 [Dreissena polymorpha]
MATLDDSPSLFSGQQWSDWADAVLPDTEPDDHKIDTAEDGTETDSMKLKLEDMPLFGLCPSRDEFYLVVCDRCNQVLKPQAFQAHLDIRHGGKGSYSTHSSSNLHPTSAPHSVSSKSHTKTHSPNKSHTKSSRSKPPNSSPTKSHRPSHSPQPLKIHSKDLLSSGTDSASYLKPVKQTIQTKASVKEPPPSFDTATRVGAGNATDKVKDSYRIHNIHKENSVTPVVKVERMRDSLAVKAHRETFGSARTSLTNGSIRDSQSPPTSLPVISDNINKERDIKFVPESPIPDLTPAHDTYIDELDVAQASEIDTAVSSILEVNSPGPDLDPDPGGGGWSPWQPHQQQSPNTVTMANMTAASTTVVTSVMNTTTSTFKLSNIGGLGSFCVNLQPSTALATNGHLHSASTSVANNTSFKSTSSSLSDTTKSSIICDSSNMESISDIVKSAVNSGNTGGFKSLSPLLSSPQIQFNSLNNNKLCSFKSPSKISNLIKSHSSVNMVKSGSKLSPGSSVFKSNSIGAIVGVSDNGGVNSDAIKKFQMLNRPDKIIPLKDREYDPNKHCGVIMAETGKPCARSLTCKSHALSLRRAVTGRRLPFDELLQEHRDAKEAYIKAKNEIKEATAAHKAQTGAQAGKSSLATALVAPHRPIQSGTTTITPVKTVSANMGQVSRDGKPILNPLVSGPRPATVQRPASISSHRSSLGSIGSPYSQDELLSPGSRAGEKSGGDEEEDSNYTPYHPRPIAACSFGARYHNNYGSRFGCHAFGRRTDYVRAIFLEMLEKHSNPSPAKKVCLESRDVDSSHSDPYEFVQLDGSGSLLGQQLVQAPGMLTSIAPNKVIKQKAKAGIISGPTVVSGTKPKLKDTLAQSQSKTLQVGASLTGLTTAGLLQQGPGPSAAKKRKGSGSAGAGTLNVQSNLGHATLVTATHNLIGNVGALSHTSSGNQPQFAIAIPSVNISGATLSQLGASLVSAGNLKHKNSVIKDMGFYVTGIPQEALLNGQIVNITNSQIASADLQNASANQMQAVHSNDDGTNKTIHQVNVINSKTLSQQQKFINSLDIRTLQVGKGGLITGLPPNAVILDGSLQGGAVLQPVSLTSSGGHTMVSVGGSVFSTVGLQSAHSAAQVRHLHQQGSTVSLVSAPTLQNGVISNQSASHQGLSQQVFQSKPGLGQPVLQQARTSHSANILPSTQLHTHNLTFHTTTNMAGIPSQISANPNSMLPGQIHIKNNLLQKPGGALSVNKMGLQPVSINIPFMTGLGGGDMQTQQRTLYITSDDPQKRSLQIQKSDLQANSSPSNSIIS